MHVDSREAVIVSLLNPRIMPPALYKKEHFTVFCVCNHGEKVMTYTLVLLTISKER